MASFSIHVQLNPPVCEGAASEKGDRKRQEQAEKKHRKLQEEADGLYFDFLKREEAHVSIMNRKDGEIQRLKTQMMVLQGRNAQLERNQEGLENKVCLLRDENYRLMEEKIDKKDSLEDQGKFESEIAGKEHFPHTSDHDNLKAIEDLKRQLEHLKMLTSLWEERYLSAEGRNRRLQNIVRVFQSSEYPKLKMAEESSGSDANSRFRCVLCPVKECHNCHRYIPEDPEEEKLCLHHPRRPLEFREWQHLFTLQNIPSSQRKNKFWPCCMKFSRTAPEGCVVGHHNYKPK